MKKAIIFFILGIVLISAGVYIYPDKPKEPTKPIVKRPIVSRGEERPKPVEKDYTETFIANISAYTEFDPGCDEYTATGERVKANYTIAMDKRYPMGTRVKIEGLPYIYVKKDNGGSIIDNRIDIYMPSVKMANEWGRQYRRVWILN